jgi:hypothetical protein
MKIKFIIEAPGDTSVGIPDFYDQVTIRVDYPGGNKEEFKAHMKKALEDWYEECTVTDKEEYDSYWESFGRELG